MRRAGEVGVERDDVVVLARRASAARRRRPARVAVGSVLASASAITSSPSSLRARAAVCCSSRASSSSSASAASSGLGGLPWKPKRPSIAETPLPFFVWQTIAAGPVERAAALERVDDGAHVVAVDLDRVPAEGLELGAHVAGVHDLLGGAVGLQVVVVDDRGEVGDAEVRRRGRRLPGLALLAVAVGEHAEDVGGVVEAVEAQRQRDPEAHREALAERAGRDLDARACGSCRDGPGAGRRSCAAPSGPRAGSSRGGRAPRTGSARRGPCRARSGRAPASPGCAGRGAGRGSRGRRGCRPTRARSRGGPDLATASIRTHSIRRTVAQRSSSAIVGWPLALVELAGGCGSGTGLRCVTGARLASRG